MVTGLLTSVIAPGPLGIVPASRWDRIAVPGALLFWLPIFGRARRL